MAKKRIKNLPQVSSSHIQEKNSIQQLERLLPDDLFIFRSEDGGDYGVDRIIEIIQNGSATNIRSHVQIKSIKKQSKSNSREALNFPVPLKTLNYLLNSLNSIFIIYNENDNIFYWEWAGNIALKRKKSKSKGKKTFSYLFSSILDNQALKRIYDRLVDDSELIKQINLTASPFKKVIITDQIHENNYRDYLMMYTEGKYEKVIALSKEAGTSSPEIYSLISLCYYSIYNYEEALKYIIEAEQQSHHKAFHKIKVGILCEKGIKENSKETLEQAKKISLEIESQDWGWMDLYNHGNILTGLEEYEEAESYFKKAIQLEPKEPMIWKNLSTIYKHQEKFDREMECLNTALSFNGDLIEALICKGISLGNNYSKFPEAIVLLKKALSISQEKMFDNSSIYYWISFFFNSLKQYENSLKIIKAGLQYHPGNPYLEKNKLHSLIIASKTNSDYEKKAIEKLKDLCNRYPDEIFPKIELLKILGRKKSINTLFPLIQECFALYEYNLESNMVLNMNLNQIILVLQNMKFVLEFRMQNNIGSLFFEEYDIGISKVQKIEMKMNLLFLALNSKIQNATENDLSLIIENHAKCFLDLSEFCTKLLVAEVENGTAEEKSIRITKIITTLPDILLIELSRQNGVLLQRNNYSVETLIK